MKFEIAPTTPLDIVIMIIATIVFAAVLTILSIKYPLKRGERI